MSHHRLTPSVHEQQNQLAGALKALRTTLELPGPFPEDVLRDAEAAVAEHKLPDLDLTHVEFVTIDPASSTDLDQALFIERSDGGYKVFYAIADVPSFVAPGGALDAETRRRGQTFYTPDGRIPLHPEIISEAAGSLLAGQLCAAFVWEFELDAAAEVTSVLVRRAQVRSRAKLSYKGVQAELDAGTAAPVLQLLKEVGIKRVELERLRGGASLNMPEQEIQQLPDGGYRIVAAPPLPVEDWNAQISLMTGMAAAALMLQGEVGILRTMPAPDEASLRHFHRQTHALGKPWDGEMRYGEYLRTLDPTDPRQLAIVHSAGHALPRCRVHALRRHGAGSRRPVRHRRRLRPFHGAVAAAGRPLRAGDLRGPEQRHRSSGLGPGGPAVPPCHHGHLGPARREAGAAVAGHRGGGAARQPRRPGIRRRRHLRPQAGEGHQLQRQRQANGNGNGGKANGNGNGPSGIVQIAEPAVTARCPGELEPGTQVRVRVVSSDIATREIQLELVG